jgi:MFS family permease
MNFFDRQILGSVGEQIRKEWSLSDTALGTLTRRWPSGRMILAGVMFFIAAPLTYLPIDAGPGNPMGFAIPMAFGVAAMNVYHSTAYSTIQDLVEPSLRGTAMATDFCAMYLLGASLGPMVMGRLSDYYMHQAALAAGVIDTAGPTLEPFKAAGLRQAMYLVPVLNLILTFWMCAAARTVPRDIEKLRTWMHDVAAHAPAATGRESPTTFRASL